jgi:exopolysaccharide biosynthesis WecB/TagA/CpsF family protein
MTTPSTCDKTFLIDPGFRQDFLGVPIDCLTLAETIAAADRAMRSRQTLQHVCINVAKFVAMRAHPDVLQKSITNIRSKFPGLKLAGSRDGYFRPEEESEVVVSIKSSRADCLFIGMPTPRKERFLARHRDNLNVPFIMGVGGGLDVLAGHVRRAPLLVQGIGFEWLFRTMQEPRRLGRRYLVTNAVFAGIIVRALTTRLLSNIGLPF